ncbi:FliO/MopB family protein [Pararoseomonas baculiformis]|uniref:FliO/MopB family protein n=1 Tax=Pararoseomonas baculiformis TaxID=2820812 RepID=UPI001FD7E7AF|nr:flagellar biosynthetic protein FliO [Pararoseomonas baculiformis]
MGGGLGQWATVAGALAVVLGLLWGAARLARRSGLAAQGARRIRLVETTPIDSRRRAVILRVDGREALIVTGGPQDSFIGWL